MSVSLCELITQATEEMKSTGYSAQSIKGHRRHWWRFYSRASDATRKRCSANGMHRYLKRAANECKQGKVSEKALVCSIAAINYLSETAGYLCRWKKGALLGEPQGVRKKQGGRQVIQLKDKASKKLDVGFRDHLRHLGYSKSTVAGYGVVVREFLHWLKPRGVRAGVGQQDVVGFIRHRWT